MIELITRAHSYHKQVAIGDPHGCYSYQLLLKNSGELACYLQTCATFKAGDRVAILFPPGFDYVKSLWAIWRAGGIGVPLCPEHPLPSLKHILEDTGCCCLLAAEEYWPQIIPLCHELGIQMVSSSEVADRGAALPGLSLDLPALILYTSGTTSKPKGVVLTHGNLQAQMKTLSEAWHWVPEDVALHVLPLHHVHGIVNILCCSLWNGSTCIFLRKFDPGPVFKQFAETDISVFMAVPTIYYKLIEFWDSLDKSHQQKLSGRLKKMRLMVSGSAALPVPILEQWQHISGQVLLERYGMTEIGMALSNPYHGERRPGFVGNPLPGVQIKLTDEQGIEVKQGSPGEILVKGPSIFKEYWNQPEVTKASFRDQWFLTGDMAVYQQGSYKILGRSSVDIIKTGGYKVSALEIEEILLRHPCIKECGVIGVPDQMWGEIIVAAIVATKPIPSPNMIASFVAGHLPSYKKPRKVLFLDQLPRNSLGKIVKPALRSLIEAREA